ncbi:Na/Pi cotransporter family protein [Candidatus Uabimicrobium sp. HlEnr_7]|uniref:Na/Pi cotransporter family protein n=1 Tax=Candidatus Uabimicrobium helgolandensis TaxID=3095367 RepID=UPI0035580065
MDKIDYFKMAYTALGGLGIFFLGMKFLSESLQAMTGGLIKKLITKATSNRVIAVLVGLSVTALIQSSSISTVMVVGLVNAQLMNLTQAVGVILGANIGTTITGWILAIKIGKYGLLLIGLGIFPMLFIKKSTLNALGKVVVALGFIFFGLQLMSGAFKPLRSDQSFLSFLQYFDAQSTMSLLGCVIIGCFMTFIIQSSSAMLGITMALASTGSLSFATAAALVLGENIGTTITAQLACIGGSTNAKRAALSHAFFNLFGVLVMVAIFQPYIAFIENLVPGLADFAETDGSKIYIAAHIAASHTIFNVSATIIFLPFIQYLTRFVCWLIPDSKSKEVAQLKYLQVGGYQSSGVSLKMASLELENMAQMVKKSLKHTRSYLLEREKPKKPDFDEVMHLETITDNIQEEITSFVCHAMEGSLITKQTEEAYTIIRAADELESIADQTSSLCIYRWRIYKNQQTFSSQAWDQLSQYYESTYTLFNSVVENIRDLEGKVDHYDQEAKNLSNTANAMRDDHIERMRDGICQPLSALTFSDIFVSLRRVKNHTINFVDAVNYQNLKMRELEKEQKK